MAPTLAIFIPSLNRPNRLEPLVQNIREVTPLPHNIYFVVSDEDSVNILDKLNVNFWVDEGGTWIERNNFMYEKTDEDVIFLGSDDHKFYPNWYENALEAIKECDGVVPVNDMFNPNGTGAFVTRNYIETLSGCVDLPGVIAYPGYKHNYADTELFDTAKARQRFKYCHESIVEHLHWAAGKNAKDITYQKSDDAYPADYELYLSRRRLWENMV